MKEYEILNESDFDKMVGSFVRYFTERKNKGLPFQKIKIISKRWAKSKSSSQHKYYWACIGELRKAFESVGYVFNQEACHEFIKRESGYTKMIELKNGKHLMITKSIADNSKDIDSKEINFLIEFIINFAAINLNYTIDARNNYANL